MNYPKILYFTCLLSGMILFGCNNSSNSNSSDEKTAEEIGKAILHTNLTDISPISVEELEAWLPKTLGGMSLTSSAPGSMSHFFGDRFSINLSSTRISREAAWEAFHSLPLDKLLN